MELKNLLFSDEAIEIPFNKESNYHDLVTININNNEKRIIDIDLGSTGGIKYELTEDSLNYFYGNSNVEILGLTSYGLNGLNKSFNKTSYVYMDSISIAGNSFYNIESSVSNKSLNLLGLAFLKNFTTTLDFPNKQLILEPYDSLNFYPKHFGIGMRMDGKKLKISSIIETSIPHQEGIGIGDEVLKLNQIEIDNNFQYCGLDFDEKDTLRIVIKKEDVSVQPFSVISTE